jgi:hypothetical protein
MFFVGILFISNLLAKTVQAGKMIWNKVRTRKSIKKETIHIVFKKSFVSIFFTQRFQNF